MSGKKREKISFQMQNHSRVFTNKLKKFRFHKLNLSMLTYATYIPHIKSFIRLFFYDSKMTKSFFTFKDFYLQLVNFDKDFF